MENKDLIIEALVRALDFEERCYQFIDFCNEKHYLTTCPQSPITDEQQQEYYCAKWAKAEDLFPETATLFPVPPIDMVRDWFGDNPDSHPDSIAEARDTIYDDALGEWLGEKAVNLRRAALSKAQEESTND